MRSYEQQVLDNAYAILRNSKELKASGHGKAVTWASNYVDASRPMGISVLLTEEEMARGRALAERVVARDLETGLPMSFQPGNGEDRLAINTRGFQAEIAASRVTHLEWRNEFYEGPPNLMAKQPDIGNRVEVKNAYRHNGKLVAYDWNPREWLYLLVTGSGPRFMVVGWMEGVELKVPERWIGEPKVRKEGFFATPAELHPLPLPDDA